MASVVRGNDDGGGIDAGTGGGEGCRGGGIDKGDVVRFVICAFWILGDRCEIGLGEVALSCENDGCVGNDFRG